jgi:hypothetical protein
MGSAILASSPRSSFLFMPSSAVYHPLHIRICIGFEQHNVGALLGKDPEYLIRKGLPDGFNTRKI